MSHYDRYISFIGIKPLTLSSFAITSRINYNTKYENKILYKVQKKTGYIIQKFETLRQQRIILKLFVSLIITKVLFKMIK